MPADDHYVRLILTALDRNPERVAVWWGDRPVTAGTLADSVRVAAGAMVAQSVGIGSVVGVLAEANSPATLILRYAANLLGATVVHPGATNAVNPADSLSADDQVEMLSTAGLTMLIVDRAHLSRGRDLCARVDRPVQLAGFDLAGTADIPDLATGEPFDEAKAACGDLAVVTYTSGSTGKPLGVSWSFPVKNQMVARTPRSPRPQTLLVTAPLTHSTGKMADNFLAVGGTVVLHDGFDAGRVLTDVGTRRINRVFLSAPQLYALTDHPDRFSADLSSLLSLMYTGCAPSPSRLASAAEAFGPRLFQLYGSSECGQISWLNPAEHDRMELRDTAGRPVPPVTVSIREPDGDREVPAGEPGEVCVRTPWGMAGYWHEPEATARVLRDGWIRTGDLGRLDASGYLRLDGRLGEVIKANGIKVYPSAVEQVLLDHPDVAQVAVFGVEDADRIERIHAVVVPRERTSLTGDQVRALVTTRLSANHAPARVEIRGDMPLAGLDKLDKKRLRAAAQALLATTDPQ
ncbi:AMP-binding protein [Rugosimonospora africana]|uniref:Fatty acid CoA ligase n=1 Tax=Rugosimonospora africana TaxID=556532 RepID=A0A8J3QL95_9ACTN|nr:AMP-binding protein [Rugosimonospora africana]GIH11899.1 fatty acid CoA ligase [Rugosimonospora africana]